MDCIGQHTLQQLTFHSRATDYRAMLNRTTSENKISSNNKYEVGTSTMSTVTRNLLTFAGHNFCNLRHTCENCKNGETQKFGSIQYVAVAMETIDKMGCSCHGNYRCGVDLTQQL